MAKIIFSVSYEIVPEKRNDYLELMKKVKKKSENRQIKRIPCMKTGPSRI